MKTMLIIQHYGGVGGSGIGLLSTIQALKDKFNIVIYCPKKPDKLYYYYKSLGLNVKMLQFNFGTIPYYNGGTPWFCKSFYKEIYLIKKSKFYFKKIIKKEKPDIVLVNSLIMAWVSDLKKIYNCKYICHVRETIPTKWSIIGYLLNKKLENFDMVFFISNYDRDYHNLKYPRQYIVRDSLRSDTNILFRKQNREILKKILFVGGADPLKGLDIALDAIKFCKTPGLKLLIAGEIPSCLTTKSEKVVVKGLFKKLYFFKIKKLLNDVDIYSKVVIIGHKNDITDLYKEVDFVVFPSKKPHQARPAIEAGEFYKPIVISNYPQTKESIIDDFNGKVFKSNSSAELAIVIDYLYKNENIIFEMGENNHNIVIEKHLYSKVCSKLATIFTSM